MEQQEASELKLLEETRQLMTKLFEETFLANMSAMMEIQQLEITQMAHRHTEQFKNWKMKMERDFEDVKSELKKLRQELRDLK